MRILITVNTSWNIVNFRSALVQALLEDGHQITVLAPPDNYSAVLADMGCRFIPLEMDAKALSPLSNVSLLLNLWRQFRLQRPDIILSFTIKNNVFGGFAARALNIPFVPNVTGLGTAFLSGRLMRVFVQQLYRSAFRRAPVVFFQNDDDRHLFLEAKLVERDQTRLLPGSGIDLRHFPASPMPKPGEDLTFLLIARLLRDKGIVEYADAARIVRAQHPNVRFQLLGDPAAENRSAIGPDMLRGWEDEGVLTHLGTTTDVRPFIASANCVVLPSYREGAPRTLLEASAMGRPIITTDVPGCRDVTDEGVTGLLCKPRDARSLSQALLTFIALPREEHAQMGKAGRMKMEQQFDKKFVIDAYREAVREFGP